MSSSAISPNNAPSVDNISLITEGLHAEFEFSALETGVNLAVAASILVGRRNTVESCLVNLVSFFCHPLFDILLNAFAGSHQPVLDPHAYA
jgi:hypothetical protein